MDKLWSLYALVRNERKKERTEMILEPLQAIAQLATLGFRPAGTKLSITNNVLVAQEPLWSQSIERSYNHDKRDDLVYLFSVIARFHKFYQKLAQDSAVFGRLYHTLVELASRGIDSIVQTYASGDHGALLQSLKMYKTMLNEPELCAEQKESKTLEDVDDVFINVRSQYNDHHFTVMLGLFELLQADPANYVSYVAAMENMLAPVSRGIQRWIHERITY